MAPQHNLRTSPARATVTTFIAVIAMVALLAAPVSAQCYCSSGRVIYSGARCYYGGYGSGQWVILPYNYQYSIYCQARGGSVGGNSWWNRVRHNNRYCYVNDYYLTTSCPNRCYNLPLC